MGPFELMDLVGVDTGFEVSKSFYEQCFGEPRWRPSPITARYVAAGLHGRKSGAGYYDYRAGEPHRPEDPAPVASAEPGEGVVVIAGDGPLAAELGQAAQARVRGARSTRRSATAACLFIDCPTREERRVAVHADPRPSDGGAHRCCVRGARSRRWDGRSAVGSLPRSPTRSSWSSPAAIRVQRAERFRRSAGTSPGWATSRSGSTMSASSRAAFALGEGVGSARDIDLGMVLGLSHPRGPLQWADTIGLDHVLSVLQALGEEYQEERYRPAPALRRLVGEGRLGRATGAGFFEYGD